MTNIYKSFKYGSVLIFLICLSWGCNIINPNEEIPTYIHIDSFSFVGNKSHDINCVWVYYNNNPVGSFDLPATIPIITTGTSGKLSIAPGILVNGRNERPLPYPFYKSDTSTLVTQPGSIVHISPVTSYYDSVKTTIISDFSDGIIKFSKWGGTTGMVYVSADSLRFEGTGSGAIFLNSAADSSIDSTSTPFPINSGAAFIEFDYKSSTQFAMGMQANLGGLYSSPIVYLAGINPNDNWRKFYLNITGFTTQYPADAYYLYIKASLTSGQTSGRLLIDNIKLVTY